MRAYVFLVVYYTCLLLACRKVANRDLDHLYNFPSNFPTWQSLNLHQHTNTLHPEPPPHHSIPAASTQTLSIENQSGIPPVMSDEDQKLMEQISLLAGKSFTSDAT